MRYGLLLLLVACTGNEATGPPDLTGSWTGANTVAALDVRLSNVVRVFPCGITFGCSGSVTVAMIRLEGTYRDQRTAESVLLASDTERRSDARFDFSLFTRDNGVNALDTVTYATTRLVGRAVDDRTIDAALWIDYQRSSGGSSVSWTTWRADSSAITLRRK